MDRAKYAEAHILFGDEEGKSYLEAIIKGLK